MTFRSYPKPRRSLSAAAQRDAELRADWEEQEARRRIAERQWAALSAVEQAAELAEQARLDELHHADWLKRNAGRFQREAEAERRRNDPFSTYGT